MVNLISDQLIADVVLRAEQSRLSYNTQTEEFRNLNTNLKLYLGDIKTIDDDNYQLQKTIDELRTKYFLTLENNLKRLPNDFRLQSQILTDAHIERYKLKSRTRRYLCEREEIKRRINFVAKNEKDQIKYINILQKEERKIHNEMIKLNEQFQHLLKYIQYEKQIYQQSMDKIDQLHIQLEQIYVERSKTEFEIQTLKEEVKLMETTKEFLQDERETILSTRIEADDYLLSCLNDSIIRIREDFNQLNQNQLEQIENEYNQSLQILEQNLLNNQITHNADVDNLSGYEQVQNEYRTVLQELTTLTDQNQSLSVRVRTIESELYTLRNDRIQELALKDNELETSKMELQTLNEKLNHLAEYDRNLKFELTLYRGVLECEYKRKQTPSKNSHLIRPTTLRTNKNSITDRTTWLTKSTNQNKFHDQQQDEILTTRHRIPSDYDIVDEKTNVRSIETEVHGKKVPSPENLWRQLTEPFNQEPGEQTEIHTNNDITDVQNSTDLLLTTNTIENEPILPSETQPSPTNTTPFTFEVHQLSSTYPQEQHGSIHASLTNGGTLSELEKSSSTSIASEISNNQITSAEVDPTTSAIPEEHPSSSSRTSSISVTTPTTIQDPSILTVTPTIAEHQLSTNNVLQMSSALTSSISSDIENSPTVNKNSTVLQNQPEVRDVYRSSSIVSDDSQSSWCTSSKSTTIPSDMQTSVAPTGPIVLENFEFEPPTFKTHRSSSTPRTSSISEETTSETQNSSLPTAVEYQPPTIDLIYPEDDQIMSRTSSIISKDESEIEKSSSTNHIPSVSQSQFLTSDVYQSSPSSVTEDRSTASEIHNTVTTNADNLEDTSTDTHQITSATGDFDSENQLKKSFSALDHNFQDDEKDLKDTNPNERRLSIEELEISFHMDPTEYPSSSSFVLTNPSDEEEEESKKILPQSDTTNREENLNSSLPNLSEEKNSHDHFSSTHHFNGLNSLLQHDSSKQSSHTSSLTDIEEVDSTTSQKLEMKFDENDDQNLVIIMQDLRYIFHDLANDQDLVEIDNDLSEKILDRLEFRDHFIRTLFDSLIQKYLVQPAMHSDRAETLDWIEFRDILFPIVTGRYTERHIRKFFDLFDTNHDGYLSLQEIAELLEVLHANDTIDLAQTLINQFDRDYDGKLNPDELIEAIKKIGDIHEHFLSDQIESQQWFNQLPVETQIITLEVPIVTFPSKFNEEFTKGITLLGRIFKRLGADSTNKQLDVKNKNLSMQMINEFISNNVNVSIEDLQFFIGLVIDKKQNTDSSINWIEFREIFFPIITSGYYTKNQIKLWFDLLDRDQNGIIAHEPVIRLLHLLQIENFEDIIDKLVEITDNSDSWTFDELIFILENVDETASHLVINHEQISTFDNDWLLENIF